MIRAIATAGLNTVETALVKATFDDDEQPKPKHVRTLIEWVDTELKGTGNTYQRDKVNIITLLEKRVEVPSWRVVLKTLAIIHTLLREADVAFTEEFAVYGTRKILTNKCAKFFDRENVNGLVYSTFVREYAEYLQEKTNTFNELSFNVERKLEPSNKNFFTDYSPNQIGRCLPKFMKQMTALVKCRATIARNEVAIHHIIRHAIFLLIKDSLRLYASIQMCLWQLICSFQKLTLEQTKWTSRTFERYFTMNKSYQEWFQRCTRLNIIEESFAPKFDLLSESLVDKLNKYIDEHSDETDTKNETKKSNEEINVKESENEEDWRAFDIENNDDNETKNTTNGNKKIKNKEKSNESHTLDNGGKKKKKVAAEENKQEDLFGDFLAFNDGPSAVNEPAQSNTNNFDLFDNTDNWLQSQTNTTTTTTTTTTTNAPLDWLFNSPTQTTPQNMSQTQNSDNFFPAISPQQNSAYNKPVNNNSTQNDLFAYDNPFYDNTSMQKGMAGQGQARKLEKKSSNNADGNPFGDLINFNEWA